MHKDELLDLLKTMIVPKMRINSLSTTNLLWLNRNLGIKNSDNPNLQPACNLIAKMLRTKDV